MIDEKRKEVLHRKWNLKIYLIYILRGFRGMVLSRKKIIASVVFTILLTVITSVILFNKPNYDSVFVNLNSLAENLRVFFVVVIAMFVLLLYIYLLGKPYGAKQMNDDFKRAGMVNHTGEAPLLLSKNSLPENKRVKVYEFYTAGIPFSLWQDRLGELESALNLKISHFEEGRNSRTIKMYAVSGNDTLPRKIDWQNKYLIKGERGFSLALGESIAGEKVSVNLRAVPHILIGGSTGSGKSLLLKLLLYQSVKKGASVIIADFKGGVDFSRIWHEKCVIITEKGELKKALTDIVNELEKRKVILRTSGCTNIDEFNQQAENKLIRLIFACDEAGELLDKTGLSKDDKAEVAAIENLLSTIARQGRAFGIHLILSTQRPDSNILSGQIKSNIDYRVCGRADLVLSQIILDKGDAHDRIAKNAQGRFINNDDILFQAYWFDERNW